MFSIESQISKEDMPMANLGAILKEEIKRLSRRSFSKGFVRIKKDMASLKRALADLKRENQRLFKDNARLMEDLKTRMAVPPSITEEEARKVRIGPKLILSQRKRLDLSREDFAVLLGVSAGAVANWEADKSKPREKVKAMLAAIRTLGKREARERLELLAPAEPRKAKPAAPEAVAPAQPEAPAGV
jgi:DNA-binding transcriptional regulator YiaG